MFNHQKAQEYELKAHINYLNSNNNYEVILADIKSNHARGYAAPHYLAQYFKGDLNLFHEFVEKMKDRDVLEVSSGILGMMPLWGNWLKGKRYALDPLAIEYDLELKSRGESWFDGVILLPQKAEDLIPELVGKIDGFIIWHNGLDHMEDPAKGIETVSKYAAKGCMLLFNTDIGHPGKPDVGHRDIKYIIPDLKTEIEKHGWKLSYRGGDCHIGYEEYTAVFEKL